MAGYVRGDLSSSINAESEEDRAEKRGMNATWVVKSPVIVLSYYRTTITYRTHTTEQGHWYRIEYVLAYRIEEILILVPKKEALLTTTQLHASSISAVNLLLLSGMGSSTPKLEGQTSTTCSPLDFLEGTGKA